MVGRKSKRTAGDEFHGAEPVPSLKAFTQFPSAPATGEDKAQWKGFCEIESDPVRILI